MRAYALYFLRRFGQFVLVVFVGINVVFFVTHATPLDPVEQAISSATQFGHSDPQAVEINPGGQVRGVSPVNELLCVEHITRTFAIGGLLGRAQFAAVDDVSFSLESARPEIFAIIGESGSGKTTLARIILNTLAPTRGLIRFLGEDISRLRGRRDRLQFMQKVQPILQNPYEAFNPLKQVDRYLFASAVHFVGCRSRDVREAAADAALRKVGLSLAEVKGRFPHELSGGQLQRAAIARALISSPALIVADEPVSMIDASLRMSIVNLFKTLRDELKVSIIYITHDLATAYYISDRVLIMQKGKVVETGLARQVLSNPQHPYTILLRKSILSPDDVDKARPG
jgi:peptide/nickel transport system ATP-binding protein